MSASSPGTKLASSSTTAAATEGGPAFNKPTKLAVAPDGTLFVSDGYGNSRVHRFSPQWELLQSWGEPGTGPGQFHVVHNVHVTPEGRVLVCDRDNERVQVFSLEGEFLDEWAHLQRPSALISGPDGNVYIGELHWRLHDVSFKRGAIEHTAQEAPAVVTVVDRGGRPLDRWGGAADRCAPGSFISPHGMAIDSRGDLYVSEVNWTMAVRDGLAPATCHTLQKFSAHG